jgi:hypothetical protein
MSDSSQPEMSSKFDAFGASVLGTSHARSLVNNQDGWTITDSRVFPFVAVVTDGVSQGPYNEVGAHIGKRIVASAVLDAARRSVAADGIGQDFASFDTWKKVQKTIVHKIAHVARMMGGEVEQVIGNYLAFSTMGALVLPYTTYFFSYGDGVRFVNGEAQTLGPFPGNEPPCISFGVLGGAYAERPFEWTTIATVDLQHFVIATDGAGRFLDHPGLRRSKVVSRLWQDDAFFRSPSAANAWLAELNKEPVRFGPGDHERFGYFDDDTTLVCVRRSRAVEAAPPPNPSTD